MKVCNAAFLIAVLCSGVALAQEPDSSLTDPDPSIQVLVDQGLQAEYNNDFEKAIGYYRSAAERGSKTGRRRLGLMYETGRGVPQDLVEAKTLYLKANDKWAHECLCTLSMSARRGSQSLFWCTKAANAGLPLAKLNLGALYRDGLGPILPDRALALRWLRQITQDPIFGEDALEMIEKLDPGTGQ